jgi:hypothetical protein
MLERHAWWPTVNDKKQKAPLAHGAGGAVERLLDRGATSIRVARHRSLHQIRLARAKLARRKPETAPAYACVRLVGA